MYRDITSNRVEGFFGHLKNLIKQNINLNLLLDRYIIEVVKELNACKK